MLTTTSQTLGSAKASVLRRVTTTTFLHSGFLISSCTMRTPTFPVAPSTIAEYCAFATPLIAPAPCSYSRRISSNSSTFVLLCNQPSRSRSPGEIRVAGDGESHRDERRMEVGGGL